MLINYIIYIFFEYILIKNIYKLFYIILDVLRLFDFI